MIPNGVVRLISDYFKTIPHGLFDRGYLLLIWNKHPVNALKFLKRCLPWQEKEKKCLGNLFV